MSFKDNDYGDCSECGAKLIAIWFKEDEWKQQGTAMYKTGRKRWNICHLECPNCLKNECIDDSFATQWT